MRTPHPNWPDEQVTLLKKLWGEGLSASKIADHFGSTKSRNAVIGKVHRLKLEGRATTKRKPTARRVPDRPRKRILVRKARKSPWQKHLDALPADLPPPAIIEAPIPEAQRRTVETLEAHHCRWPIGDPQEADFHFCGSKKIDGLPYCECHARRAYNTAAPSEKATPRRSPITGSFVGLHRTLLEDA